MKKFLFVLLLGFPLSLTAMGQEAVAPLPVAIPQQVIDVPPPIQDAEAVLRALSEIESLLSQIEQLGSIPTAVLQEFRPVIQPLYAQLTIHREELKKDLRSVDDPTLKQVDQRIDSICAKLEGLFSGTDSILLPSELDNAIKTPPRYVGAAISTRQSPIPHQNVTSKSLIAEKEKAYIELARQYFYVFATTPIVNKTDEEANEAGNVASEPVKDQRAEILDNFTACMKKISPVAQIALIQELIRSSHTNEELKLLEGLLDEVCVQPSGN